MMAYDAAVARQADRYLALCELAMCSRETPILPSHRDPAAWLQARLALRGHQVPVIEVLTCLTAWRNDTTRGSGTVRITRVFTSTRGCCDEGEPDA